MSLDLFFNPRSVAIIGASREKGKVGYEILRNMIAAEFPGDIYPVNPKADTIEGLKCFPNLDSIGSAPDLVIIVIPAKFVPSVMEDCAKIGVKAVVVITAGFKEVGAEGLALEKKIVQIARQSGIRVIGPNCLGVIETTSKVNASFGGDLPIKGGIGYLSQSGALLAAILDMANSRGIGFSRLVSIGNKSDVDELDLIRSFGEDTKTKVIAGYLESITDGTAFVTLAEQISQQKPTSHEIRLNRRRCQSRVKPYWKHGRQRNCLRLHFYTCGHYPLRIHKRTVRLCSGICGPAAS